MEEGFDLGLGNRANRTRHQLHLLRKLIPPRCRDHQPFLGPGHAEVEEFHVLDDLGFRGFDLAEADEDHGAELKALAALHGEDVDLGFPGIVGPLAAACGHEQMGDEFPWNAENLGSNSRDGLDSLALCSSSEASTNN